MSEHGSGFLERGGAWVVAQFVLMSVVILAAIVLHGDGKQMGMTAVGAALCAAGGCFGVAGAWALGRARTAFPRPKRGAAFVQHGIYARVRHPLYTSVLLLSAGGSLLLQSWPALVLALVQIPFLMAKARREERWLCEKFPDYADYAKRVPRFVPRLKVGEKMCL